MRAGSLQVLFQSCYPLPVAETMLARNCLNSLLLTAHPYGYTPCPLLGQSWALPTDLPDAPDFPDALAVLQARLENTTITGLTDFGTWSSTNNFFSLGVFDATSPEQLFTFQYSSEALQNAEQGVKEVTEDTIFRIGSNSKLITVYLFLIEVEPEYWNRQVTDFVPRLAKAATKCSAHDAHIDCIHWNEITLGSLASHMGGLPRACRQFSPRGQSLAHEQSLTSLSDSTFAEVLSPLNGPLEAAVSVGFPPLPISAAPPCGLADQGCPKDCKQYYLSPKYPLRADELQVFLDGFSAERPRFAPFTTPLYSNGAFAILAIALENITGRSFEDMLNEDLFGKLNMTGSSYRKAKSVDGSAIPPGAELVFGADTKASTP